MTPTRRRSRRDLIDQNVESISRSTSDLATEVNRVVQAWSEANTSLITGSIRVFSDLLTGLNDAAYRRSRDLPEEDEEFEERDVEEAGEPIARLRGSTADVTRTIGRAFNEQAKVVQRSYARFTDAYESQAGTARGTGERYADMTVGALREEARARDIQGRSEMNRDALVRALQKSDQAEQAEQYQEMTLEELREEARVRDIQGRSDMNKDALIGALQASDRGE